MSNSRNPSPPTTSDCHGSPTSITSDPLVLKYATMPPINRSAGRNVHIYDGRDRTTALGGLILNTGVTNANFYAMIRIFVEFTPRNYLALLSAESKPYHDSGKSPAASTWELLHCHFG